MSKKSKSKSHVKAMSATEAEEIIHIAIRKHLIEMFNDDPSHSFRAVKLLAMAWGEGGGGDEDRAGGPLRALCSLLLGDSIEDSCKEIFGTATKVAA
jgi:hypothetical protein